MKKRLLSLLLVLVTVLGLLPTAVLAASSETEALGEIDIYNGGTKLSYLSINGRRELIYTYYNYVDGNGKSREIPAAANLIFAVEPRGRRTSSRK